MKIDLDDLMEAIKHATVKQFIGHDCVEHIDPKLLLSYLSYLKQRDY